MRHAVRYATNFRTESRYFADVLKFRDYTLEDASSIPEYISNIWRLFKRIVKPNPTERDAVEFVIGSVSDERIRTELLNSKSDTVPELIAVAKTMRKRKLSLPREGDHSKRPYLSNEKDREQTMTCYVSGKIGHRARDCKNNALRKSEKETGSQIRNCSHCGKTGHTYETCFKRQATEKENTNLC